VNDGRKIYLVEMSMSKRVNNKKPKLSKKVEAIILWRVLTGKSLIESLKAVEALQIGN